MTGTVDDYVVLQIQSSQLPLKVITLKQAKTEGLEVDLDNMLWGAEGEKKRHIRRLDCPEVEEQKGFIGVYDRTRTDDLQRLADDTTYISRKYLIF